MKYVWTAIRMTIVTAVIAGIIYPLAMTGIAQVVFPGKADGSLIKKNGVVIGSSLIGQNFTAARYFQPRPSAAGHAATTPWTRRSPTWARPTGPWPTASQAAVKADIAAEPGPEVRRRCRSTW